MNYASFYPGGEEPFDSIAFSRLEAARAAATLESSTFIAPLLVMIHIIMDLWFIIVIIPSCNE